MNPKETKLWSGSAIIMADALARIAFHKDREADFTVSPYDERGDAMWRKGLGVGHRRCAQIAEDAINAIKLLEVAKDE
jgi:hypothetical protein